MKKIIMGAAALAAVAAFSTSAYAKCDPGEIVIKFSHFTNTDKHPKGIAATLLEKRINSEMQGKAFMKVYPNSSLYNDNKVFEALLQGDVQLAAPSLSKFEKFTKNSGFLIYRSCSRTSTTHSATLTTSPGRISGPTSVSSLIAFPTMSLSACSPMSAAMSFAIAFGTKTL